MSLFDQGKSTNQILFEKLFFSNTEAEIDEILKQYPEVFQSKNWHPLGGNSSNYGIVKNQQSAPIAALIEKITNSIVLKSILS